MVSLWQQESNRSDFEELKQDIKTDILIIGGGMAGILCAYMLQQAGIPYVLAEAQTVCSGIIAVTQVCSACHKYSLFCKNSINGLNCCPIICL